MKHSTLVSCEELARHLTHPDLRIVDCRHQLSDAAYGETAYTEGHVPGALFMHLDRDLSGPMNGRNGRHPLPEPRSLAGILGAAGISREKQVVAYDDAGGMIAGRLWWLLRWLGHDRVAVLDGGIARWLESGGALSTDQPEERPCRFEIDVRDWVVSGEEVLANIDGRSLVLVDARSADRFRGENETLDPVGGHIPGARNRFFRDNLDERDCFRPAAQLLGEYRRLLAGAGPENAVMMCGSGVTACHNLLAMEIAGLQGARLYAGSWSEWCTDPARPVER